MDFSLTKLVVSVQPYLKSSCIKNVCCAQIRPAFSVLKVVCVGAVLLGTVSTLAGCASSRTSSPESRSGGDLSESANSSADPVGTETSAALTASSLESVPPSGMRMNVSSRMLIDPSSAGFGLELVDGDNFNQLVLQSSAGKLGAGTAQDDVRYEVSRLTEPARLVVDLYGVKGAHSKTFETADSALVSRIRVGVHSDKTRIVLDLAKDNGIEHRVEKGQTPYPSQMTAATTEYSASAQNEIKITLAQNGEVAKVAEYLAKRADFAQADAAQVDVAQGDFAQGATYQDDYETAAHTPPETLDKELATKTSQAYKTDAVQEAAVQDSMDTEARELAESSPVFPRVTALSLEPAGFGENMLVAKITSPTEFSLRRTAPSEYVMSFSGVELDSDARMTLLAPKGDGSIRSVRPVVNGSQVDLRIFSAPNIELRAQASRDKIVLIADPQSAAMAQADGEARAQAAADAAAGSEAAKPADSSQTNGAAAASNGTEDDLNEGVAALLGDQPRWTGRLISLDLQDTDIDNALRIIAEVSNLNIIASEDVTGKVTLRLIDVPWDQALDVILKTNGLDKVQEGNVIRIAPVEKLRLEREALKQAQMAEEELEPLQVRYIRVSYAKASELKTLVESVVTERGSVAYDERTNQLIVKDIRKGIKNVAELVSKLDLRTPQVLIETQIVEANRNFLRDLGASLGYTSIQSPATGNPTGDNFPNAITSSWGSDYAITGSSILDFVLESADGTKSLTAQLQAEEAEGRARVISRPAVATTNNQAATIKSVEKLRIKTPSGGVNVSTGSGASSGGSPVATETIEIGIILEVTPQASPDYFVLLDINAKSSTLGSERVDGIPSEIERSATSTILVSSGQTFALGGIYKISETDSITGTPWFKDVPVIGTLFRSTNVNNRDEELLFFLTPRIIEGSFDDAAMKAVL